MPRGSGEVWEKGLTYNKSMVVTGTKKNSVLIPRKIKKILRDLKKGLIEIYGDQLKAVYLFGSFARGEGKLPDSDIDVMIVLKGVFNHREQDQRSWDLIADLSLHYDVLISTKLVSETKYSDSKMPLYINVRREGLQI
jgi:predicted nucleotidyltransferase